MKRIALGVLICLIAGLLAVQAVAADTVRLQYKFKPGEVKNYSVREKNDCDKFIGGMALHSDWDAVLVLKVLTVLPDGGAEIEASYESGTMRVLNTTHKIKPGEVAPVKFKVTKYGKILDLESVLENPDACVEVRTESVEGPNKTANSLKTNVYQSVLRSFWQEFPSKDVKAGEKWKQDVLSPTLQGSVSALNELQKVSGKQNQKKVLSILRTINEKSPSTPPDPQGPFGSISEKSKTMFSVDKGQIESVTNSGKLLMQGITVPSEDGQETQMDMTITYSTSITLLASGTKK